MLLASVSDWLLPMSVGAVPAAISLAAAYAAVRSARASQQAEHEAARLRALEDRLSAKKYEVYEPMINLLGSAFGGDASGDETDEAEQIRLMRQFATWIGIFGSDGAVGAYHNFMQGAFHKAPPYVAVRLYADFVIAARRDMGDPDTSVDALTMLGLRINDLYEKEQILWAVTAPFETLCASAGWAIPWASRQADPAGTAEA